MFRFLILWLLIYCYCCYHYDVINFVPSYNDAGIYDYRNKNATLKTNHDVPIILEKDNSSLNSYISESLNSTNNDARTSSLKNMSNRVQLAISNKRSADTHVFHPKTSLGDIF